MPAIRPCPICNKASGSYLIVGAAFDIPSETVVDSIFCYCEDCKLKFVVFVETETQDEYEYWRSYKPTKKETNPSRRSRKVPQPLAEF